ncbi:MAG: T9SS type A sorting domain-containing protein [FCB group bacterium]|nr:T9SS type A sorting domain-containing protein [FCB group bacterium]
MKTMLISLVLLMIMLSVVSAAPRPDLEADKSIDSKASSIDNTSYIDVNRILMFVTNHGNFGRDLSGVFGYDYGTWYPYTGDLHDIYYDVKQAAQHSPLYAGGLWIGAVDSANGEIRVTASELSSEYVPGTMYRGTFTNDRAEYRIYKLYSDSLAGNPNQDYMDWPINQGAPMDEQDNPEMLGDQMLWSVYNDGKSSQHDNLAGSTAPLGLEIRQTTYAYNRQGSLGNVVFLRWRIYNKGANTLNDCRFSIWIDPDIGSAGDDLVGCDTIRALGFAYNGDNVDPQYTNMPIPSVGVDILQGPMEYTANIANTGHMWGYKWPYYRNTGMSSFSKYNNRADPNSAVESFNLMQGLTKTGEPYVFDGDTLMHMRSGDPLQGLGDLDTEPYDRRFLANTGPIATFRPGDSTEIIAALIVGVGADYLASVAVMKEVDMLAQNTYRNSFDGTIGDPQTIPPLPYDFSLSQNYPNPFNASTRIEFSIDQLTEVSIDIYNILGQKITTILSSTLPANNYSIFWDGTDSKGATVATGIYFYRLRAGDLVETRKMLLLM